MSTINKPELPDNKRPGYDLLRSLAGYPTRSVQLGHHAAANRVVIIQRDASGRVIGSTERTEQSEITDVVGDWLN